MKTSMETKEFINHYKEAAVKFTWEYSEIKDYVPVIERATFNTINFLKNICDENIDENDIGIGIIYNENVASKIILYIKNKKLRGCNTVYSSFKEEYRSLAKGYDDKLLGFSMLLNNFERAKEFFKSIGFNDEQAKIKWDEIQFFKRKITTFNTLANKSLNKSRKVTAKLRFQVLSRDKFRCVLCGESESKLHVDHLTPVSKSGKNDMDNLMTLCQECNLGKGAMATNEWFLN